MATQYSNKPIVLDGLVYALDFGNQKSYVSGSSIARSLVFNPTPATFQTVPAGDYQGLAAAYSVRKVVSSYTGSAMMIQSASVSQSIGFDSNGNLDTASIAAFAGSGDAFVKIWYDQSGNGYHVSQSTLTNQPQIYSGSLGSVILENGRPALKFDGVNDELALSTYLFLGSQARTMIGVYKPNALPSRTNQLFGQNGSNSSGNWCLINFSNSPSQDPGFQGFGQDLGGGATTPDLLQKVAQFYYSGTNASLYKNGTLIGSAARSLNNQTDNIYKIGNRSGFTENANASIQEVLNWTSDQSTNRINIQNNINNYYNIFSPTSSSPIPGFTSGLANFESPDALLTNQTFTGFSYDRGNSTIMYVGETKGTSSLFTQDTNLSVVATTSSVGFGSTSNNIGRTYPVSGLKHVALRFSSGSVDCFVNGIPVPANSVFPTGSSVAGGRFAIPVYTGSLGLVQVYNRPLTGDEIWNNYQLTSPRYGLGAVQNKPYTLDDNAYLFLSQSGITDPIITGSIDTFVRGLKSASLWDKMIAIYPFVGTGSVGTNLTGSHRWNLKEPSLVTYPLTFTGSWNGSTSGSTPSGSNTNISAVGITPSIVYPNYLTSSVHISILSYDTPVSRSYLMGTGMTEDLAVSTLAGDYGTPAAAYSVRKVRTAYSGALMDVRRSYDNVTSSIGYVSNGDLDTGSLLDFVVAGRAVLPGAYSGLAAAYSLRRVSGSYTGPAVDVRRSYDNTTGSVGFDSNGNLNTSSLFNFVNVSENLLPYSQDLAKTGSSPLFLDGWINAFTQVTASTVVAPDGTLTGNTLNTTNNVHFFGQRISGSYQDQQMIFSFWAKTGSMTAANLSVYDITNSTEIIAPTSYYSQITSGQWTYVTASFTVPSTCVTFQVYPLRDSGVTGNIYIWGAQLRTSSYVDGYVKTTGSKATPGPVVFGTASHSFGYVNTWYDQSGNNRHATQTTASSQPLIVSSGSLVTQNGRPAVRFDGVSSSFSYNGDFIANTKYSIYHVSSRNSGKNHNWILGGSANTINQNLHVGYRFDNLYRYSQYANDLDYTVSTYSTPILDLFSVHNTPSGKDIFYNNIRVVSSSDTADLASNTNSSIGYFPLVNEYYSGSISELVFFTGSNVSSSRPLIENNINNYYNIYTGSNHGFVVRWYDQSGNNRHATQTATGSQPVIVLSGSLILTNGKPAPTWVSSSLTSSLQGISRLDMYVVQQANSTAYLYPHSSNPSSNYGMVVQSGSTSTNLSSYGATPTFFVNSNLFSGTTRGELFTAISSSQRIVVQQNTSTTGWANFYIAAFPGLEYSGSFQEMIFYSGDQSSNRGPIEYGINSYYNIYPQTSSFATSSFTISATSGSVFASLNNRLTSGIASSGPLGLITVSRTGSNSLSVARNGSVTSFAVPASGALSTGIYLGAINNNSIALGNSPLNISFASVGIGLTNSETQILNRQVQLLKYNLQNPSIVTNGLVLNLDALIPSSYPGTGNTWFDLSGNNNNGTLTNGPVFTNDNGGTIVFDGTNDYISFQNLTTSDLGLNTPSGASLGCWLKLNVLSRWTGVFAFWSSGDQCDFGWDLTPANNIRLWKQSQTGLGITPYNNQWAYYVLTSSPTGVVFYINGVVSATWNNTNNVPFTSNRYLTFGDHWDSPIQGNSSQIQIYNRALTDVEVLQNFNATRGRFGV